MDSFDTVTDDQVTVIFDILMSVAQEWCQLFSSTMVISASLLTIKLRIPWDAPRYVATHHADLWPLRHKKESIKAVYNAMDCVLYELRDTTCRFFGRKGGGGKAGNEPLLFPLPLVRHAPPGGEVYLRP